MRPRLADVRGRTAAAGASILLLAGLTAGMHANAQEASAVAALESATRAQVLAQKKAAISAAAHAEVLADATALVRRAGAAWEASAGKVDDVMRAELVDATRAVDDARVAEDHAAVLAGMPALRDAIQRVESATDDHDVAAARDTANGEPADRVVHDEAAGGAAEEEAAGAATEEQAAGVGEQPNVAQSPPVASPEEIGHLPVEVTASLPAPPAAPTPATSRGPVLGTITGTLHVRQGADAAIATGCGGYGRFADIQNGTPVTISDAHGEQVGSGQLSACRWRAAAFLTGFRSGDYQLHDAVFSYTVPVPEGAGAYTIRVGSRVWAPIAEAELRADGWKADLTLE